MLLKLLLITFVTCFVINNVNSAKNVKNERIIEGKIVIVTGGAQGIGFAIADNFLGEGAETVIILDINVTKGKEAENKLNSKYGCNKADFIECDVTKDLDRVAEIVMKKYKYVDVLINNAGINDENKPRKLFTTNAIATIESSLKFNEYMRKDKCGGKGGTIMNIASIVVHYIDPVGPVYKGSKFAISGFSQSLGHDYTYKQTGVRVLVVCPGVTNTTLGQDFYTTKDKKLMDALVNGYHYKIIQPPDHVGKGIVELFKCAETGTSWDIQNIEPPFESTKTVKVIKVG